MQTQPAVFVTDQYFFAKTTVFIKFSKLGGDIGECVCMRERIIEGKEYFLLHKEYFFPGENKVCIQGFRKHRIFYHTGYFKCFGVFVTQQNSVLHRQNSLRSAVAFLSMLIVR